MDTMDRRHEGATRRNFILAGSAEAIFALNASVAFGQSSTASPEDTGALDRLIERTNFLRAGELSRVFRDLWKEKIELALARVAEDVEAILSEIVNEKRDELVKEFGADDTIPRERLRVILAGTIYFQNIIVGVSTDAKSGIVSITAERIASMRAYYCSIYPYCR
jgi:hypothetical protein